MIHDVLAVVVDLLAEHLAALSGGGPEESGEERVVLPDGDKLDPIVFRQGAVTVLVVNLEEERVPRAGDPYRRTLDDGTVLAVQPEIRLGLGLLFVARFKDYAESWRHLSQIIRFFQRHRVLDHRSAPALVEGIDKLIVELVTLPFAEQNEIWSALRTAYQPSVLYRVRLVVFADETAVAEPPVGDEQLVLEQVVFEDGIPVPVPAFGDGEEAPEPS